MAKSPNMKFAIFYPEISEDDGYLFIRMLGEGRWGEGFQGMVCMVWNTKGELFVRKNIIPAADIWSNILPVPEITVGSRLNHRLVPPLISNASYQVLKDDHKDSGKHRSETFVFAFCNGGTLDDLLKNVVFVSEKNPAMSNTFAWTLFKDALEAITYVHGEGFSHQDGHPGNYFLHWDTTPNKLPICMLGDYGGSSDLKDLDRDYLKPGEIEEKIEEKVSNGEVVGTLEEETMKMIEERKAEVTRQIGIDLDYVSESVAQIITGITNVCSETQMHKMQQLRADPAGFDQELIDAWHFLNDIIDDLYKGDGRSYENELVKLQDFVNHHTAHRILECQDYSWTRPTPPPAEPRVFDTRQDLLRACEEVPGPFRIARVDPETLKVIGVETTQLNLHSPPISELGDAFKEDPDLKNPKHLLPTVDVDGKDDII